MATPTSKDDVLSFGVLVDIRASLQAMEKFSRSMKKSMKTIAESGERMGKQSQKTSKKGKKDTDEWANSLENLNQKYEYQNELLKKRGDTLRELRKMSGDNTAQIEVLEKEFKQMVGVMKAAKHLKERGGAVARSIAPKGMKKAMLAAGEELKNPLQNFLKKDAHGLVEDAGRMFTKSMSRGFHGARLLSRVGGARLQNKGTQRIAAGEFGGAAMKKMGELMSGFSKLIRPLASLAPVLSAVGVGLVAIVKLFLDAQAMVKEFNKSIMDSASNLEFMERASGSAMGGIKDMGDALDAVRKGAMDPGFNNALGITKDTHIAILNTLNQEGVAMGNLYAEAGKTSEGMTALSQSIVHAGVMYSRSLGVPLQEVMSLQAEMMVEMGRGAKDTEQSFTHIVQAATASGIAGNKFFGIIRAASADLSLWNLRLEGAVDLLGKLGKILNPREAQKFFQSISSGFKSMGRQDLLKQGHMFGIEKLRGELAGELAQQQEELAKQIIDAGGRAGDEAEWSQLGDKGRLAKVKEQLELQGYQGADQLIRGVTDPRKIGTLRGKAAQTERLRQGAQGDAYQVTQASSDIESVPRQMKIIQGVLESFGGSLANPNELGLAAVADSNNYSVEQVKQLNAIALAAEEQRRIMLDGAKSDAGRAKIQAMDYVALTEENSSLKSMTDQFAADAAGGEKEKTVQEAIADMSKEQGQRTQDLATKLETLMNWFMNEFYQVVLDIWEGLLKFFKWGSKEDIETKRKVLDSKNPVMQTAFRDAQGDTSRYKGSLLAGGSAYSNGLRDVLGRGSKTGATDADRAVTDQFHGAIVGGIQGNGIESFLKAIQVVVKDPARLSKVEDNAKRKKTKFGLSSGLNDIGLSPAEVNEVWNQVLWELSPKDLTALGDMVARQGAIDGGSNASPPISPAGPAALGTSVVPAGPTSPAVTTAQAVTTANTQLDAVVQGTQQTNSALTQQGIRIAPATLKEDAKGMEASMLSALRTALFEFYMYSGTDRGSMLTAMRAGNMGPGDVGKAFTAGSLQSGAAIGGLNAVSGKPAELPARALGGYVTGIANGLAVVAAQGEGLASIGRGERIVPSGGGGSGANINVSVNGIGGADLARLIEGKVVEGVREYKRREKFN